LDVEDPFDSADAIDGGARYLASNLRRTHGNVRLAVAAYNAGPGAVDDGVMPKNGQTEFYVAKVMKALSRQRATQARPPLPPGHPP
jgi:soluble lytic murein transglycosylase-like protein